MSSKDKNLVIVRAVLDQGLSPTQAADRFSVSRQWVHTLLTRYRLHGPDGLEPRSRAPHTRPSTTTQPVRQEILRLRRTLTTDGADAGPLTIAWHLERAGLHAPSSSTIRRILRAEGLIDPARPNDPAAPTVGSKPSCPMSAGKQTSPTPTSPPITASRSSTSSMTTPATCSTSRPPPRSPAPWSSRQ